MKRETGADDALGAVGDGAADEDDGGRDADDGRDGFDAPAEFRRELVERETEDDGNEHDLDGGNAMPMASTSTTAPSANLQIKGVMKMHPTVVAVVMSTDNATSPLAMYAHRLLACPPLMEPTRINPARSGPLNPNAFPMTKANAGMSA